MKVEKIDYARGWRGAVYVKRQTNKLIRRLAKQALNDNEDPDELVTPTTINHVVRGWTY